MSVASSTSHSYVSRAARLACMAGLTAALTFGQTLAPATALAATAETSSSLASLQQQVSDAAATYQTATDKASQLQSQIDELSDEILELESEKLPEQQKKASDATSNLYKMQMGSADLLTKLFTADSFSDFITLTKYATTIQEENTSELDNLNKLKDELSNKIKDLSSAKDEADSELQKASDALDQAKSAASAMQEKANAEDATEQAAAQQAVQQAAALEVQASGSSSTATVAQDSSSASTGSSSAQTSTNSSSSASTSSNTSNSGSSTNSNTSTNTGSWLTGSCSAYGSTSDNTLGHATATGAIVTESSMGIAMPIGKARYGAKVELNYGGKTCIAVVNDCGGFGSYGRTFDLQPGVWRALGASSCEDWGVRTVSYRWLS